MRMKDKKGFDIELMPLFWLGEFLNGDLTVHAIEAPIETMEKAEGFKDRAALCGVTLDWKTVWKPEYPDEPEQIRCARCQQKADSRLMNTGFRELFKRYAGKR
jgi:hypothetical protein